MLKRIHRSKCLHITVVKLGIDLINTQFLKAYNDSKMFCSPSIWQDVKSIFAKYLGWLETILFPRNSTVVELHISILMDNRGN